MEDPMLNQSPERIMRDCARLPLSRLNLCAEGACTSRYALRHREALTAPLYRVGVYARGVTPADTADQILHCQLVLGLLMQSHPVMAYLFEDPEVAVLPPSLCLDEPSGLCRLLDDGLHDVFDIVVVSALDRLTDGRCDLCEEVIRPMFDAGMAIISLDEGCIFHDSPLYCLAHNR